MAEFTGLQINSLVWAAEMAIDDQRAYLATGNCEADYGKEWPDAAEQKAALFSNLADAIQKFGATRVAEECEALAKEFMEAA